MNMIQIIGEIGRLRSELDRLFTEKGSLHDPEIIKVSQELDQLINTFYRLNAYRR